MEDKIRIDDLNRTAHVKITWHGEEAEVVIRRMTLKEYAYFIRDCTVIDATTHIPKPDIATVILSLPKYIIKAPWDMTTTNALLDSDELSSEDINNMVTALYRLIEAPAKKK